MLEGGELLDLHLRHQRLLDECHVFLGDGRDICTVQELLGHREVSAPMICTQTLNCGPVGARTSTDHLGSP